MIPLNDVLKSVATRCLLLLAVMVMLPIVTCPGQGGPPSAATVRTAIAQQRTLNQTQSFIGTLRPIRRATIGSAVEDRVTDVLVDEGDFVEGPGKSSNAEDAESTMGQELVRIDRSAIDLERVTANVALELSKQTLTELELSLPVEIELAEAQVAQAESQKEYAQSVLERLQALGSAATGRELEESRSQFETQSQALVSAKAELQRLTSTREIRMLIAKQNIAAREAELLRVEDLQSKYIVRAPFSGYITRVLVEQGSWVTRSTPVVELVQLDPLELLVNVPQEYYSNLIQTQGGDTPTQVAVQVQSIDGSFEGEITEIIPQADERTRAVPVVIQIANPVRDGSRPLVPGLIASAMLEVGRPESVVMIPKDALVLNQYGTRVFVVRHDGDEPTVEQLDVVPGTADQQWIAVTGPLQEGDEVVVQGNERLRSGQAVKILE